MMKVLNIKLISDIFNRTITAPAFNLHFEKMMRLYGNLEDPTECFELEFMLGIQLTRRACEEVVHQTIQSLPPVDYVTVYVTQLTYGVMHLINTLRKVYGNRLRIYGITNKHEVLPCTIVNETISIDLDVVNKTLPIFKYFDAIPELFKFKVTPLGELDLVYYEEVELLHANDLTEYAELYKMLDTNYNVQTTYSEQSTKLEARQNKLRLVD